MKKLLLTLIICATTFFSAWSQCVPSCSVYVVASTTPSTGISAVGHNTISFSNGDDALSGAMPIGFSFQFYCQNYTSFIASTNGFITFDLAASNNGCCSGSSIPNTSTPNNYVALRWTDLNMYSTGFVTYTTVGTAPNRQCIITYTNVAIYGNPSLLNTGHIILYETTNEITVHSIAMATSGNICTQGIENSSGSLGVASPGANGTSFAFNNTAYRFFAGGSPTPVSALSGSSLNICQGTTQSYTAAVMPGATSYNWSMPAGWTGTSTTNVLTATAGSSGLISVSATYSCGTSTAINMSVTTVSAPAITGLSVTPLLICSGETVMVNGTSNTGVTYTLMPGNVTGFPPFIVSPASSTDFILLTTNSIGCTSFNSPTVSVNVKQTPTITINSGNICLGESFALNPSGASQYTLSSLFTGVTPQTAGTHTYSAVGTNSTGCVSQPVVATVVVKPLPATTATVSRSTICIKESATIGAGGASTYSWVNAASTSQTLDVSPLAPVSYTVIGTSNGCSKAAVVTLQVVSCTGIESNGITSGNITVYPNPSSGEYNITTPVSTGAVVYDMLGKIVYEKQLSEGSHKLNISHLAAGKYLLRTTNSDGQQSTVLIKQ